MKGRSRLLVGGPGTHSPFQWLNNLLFCGLEDEPVAQEQNLCATGVPPHCSVHTLAQVREEVNKLIPSVEEQIGRLPVVIQAALDEAVPAGRIEGAPNTTTILERTIMKVLEASGIQDIPQLLCQGTRALPSTEELHAQQHTLADFGLRPLASLPRDFMVPNMTLRKAWQYWTSGDGSTCHRPWRYTLPAEMGDKKALDRFKRFRKVKLAVQEAMWKDIAQFQEYDAMFDAVEASFEYP